MNTPLVSAVVPTYLREEPLRNTLVDLVRQDYPNFEVLVIDQTPKHEPETESLLKELEADKKIIWLRVTFASLPGARNYAVRRTQGEIIVFIDDDVRLQPDFLNAHVQIFLEKPEVGAIAGRVLDRAMAEQKERGEEEREALTIDYLPAEAMDPGIAWYFLDFIHTVKPQEVISARGCNMSFRQELFNKYQLTFDERMRGSAVREESDFCLRVRQTGYKIWYSPDAALFHLGEPTGGCHDVSTRSLKYQITHYHNHFWMGFKT